MFDKELIKNNCKVLELIKHYNRLYKIKNFKALQKFPINLSLSRNYFYKNILSFGDALHKIHPLAGQGFNMTLRDIRSLVGIIKNKQALGLPIDSLVNKEFEDTIKHKNYIFSNGVDLVYEFFNFERKINNNALSRSIKIIAKNPYINKLLINFADKGIDI